MAASTADTESAQALFCSLADYLGSNESAKRLDVNKYKTFQCIGTKSYNFCNNFKITYDFVV